MLRFGNAAPTHRCGNRSGARLWSAALDGYRFGSLMITASSDGQTTGMSSVPSDQTELPHADNSVGKDVVIYDGHCRICSAQMRRLARWDFGKRLAYLSLHDAAVAAHYPDLRHDDLMREMVVVDRKGGRHAGADAVRYLSRRLPALWVLAPLLHIPGTSRLWRRLYRFVAEHRYLLGKTETCDSGSCSLHR